MGLVKKLLWLLLFAVFTFAFTVLFEFGTANYAENFSKEAKVIIDMVRGEDKKSDKDGEKPTP